jgi:hypothetical protein
MDEPTIIYMDTGRRRDLEYIGDGVYASHDDAQVWLSLDGQDDAPGPFSVALDPSTLHGVLNYARKHGLA